MHGYSTASKEEWCRPEILQKSVEHVDLHPDYYLCNQLFLPVILLTVQEAPLQSIQLLWYCALGCNY